MFTTTANRNPDEIFAWQDICITLDDMRISEKNICQSKEDLKNKLLIIDNPLCQSGFYRKYADFVNENINHE